MDQKDKMRVKMGIRSVMFENEQVKIDEIIDVSNEGDDLLEELLEPDQEFAEYVEFNEATIKLLKNAYMSGFMKSNEEFNGANAKVRYRESMLKPDSIIWNENLKTSFKRFLYNEKKKQERA